MRRAYVVVLTVPGGYQMLTHTSLMTAEEAEGEASVWRHTPCPRSTRNWTADVREVPL